MEQPPTPEQSKRGELAKFIASFGYAFHGLWYALRTQRNMRVHLAAAIIITIAGIFLHVSAVEFAMLYVAIAGVMIAEMFNTVFEICVNLAKPEYHPLAGIAKDVAAGAVLLSALLAVVIGVFVFGPHLWALIRGFVATR